MPPPLPGLLLSRTCCGLASGQVQGGSDMPNHEGFAIRSEPVSSAAIGTCTQREPLTGHDRNAIPKRMLFRAPFRRGSGDPPSPLDAPSLPLRTYGPWSLFICFLVRQVRNHARSRASRAAVCRLKSSLVHIQRLGPGVEKQRPRKTRNRATAHTFTTYSNDRSRWVAYCLDFRY